MIHDQELTKTKRAQWATGLMIALVLCVVVLPSQVSAAVQLSSFTANWQGSQVVVSWTTATECNNVGFYIYRSNASNGSYVNLNPSSMIFTKVLGSCTTGASYSFTDSSVTLGQAYYYKLQHKDSSGNLGFYSLVVTTASATPTATVTPTRTSTATPQFTATRTPTYPPGVTPPTSTATSVATVSYTPTRTPTYPPGVTPPTPLPSATTQKVAIAQPAATVQRPGSNSNAQNSNPVVPTTAAPPQDVTTSPDVTSDPVDQNNDANPQPSANNNALQSGLIQLGVIALSGLLGLGAVVFGAIAIILFVRLPSHRH